MVKSVSLSACSKEREGQDGLIGVVECEEGKAWDFNGQALISHGKFQPRVSGLPTQAVADRC